jgi:coenzyme F420 hydrogenase subunit beta
LDAHAHQFRRSADALSIRRGSVRFVLWTRARLPEMLPGMDVGQVRDDGLCMQCGTCVAVCPTRAVSLDWSVATGYRVAIDRVRCTDCGTCLEACPGPGVDFRPGAWWRERNAGAATRDFLGPWRRLWIGWASDPEVRHFGSSGGVATAILAGLLEKDLADAVLAVGLSEEQPLQAVGRICRSPAEVAACRGSKYNVVPVNTLLRTVLHEPGRYVLVGLPCHVQGLRLAQRRSRRLRERVVLTLGIFCGLTGEPRATEVAALHAGLDPEDLASVSYRGPGWPGGMRLVTRDGGVSWCDYPQYYDRQVAAHTPPRCRVCPDALAELADISVGDTWLDRFEGCDGVSDLIVRTPAGERSAAAVRDRLRLEDATPDVMVGSQAETYLVKRDILRGRLALRAAAGRPNPAYAGLDLRAHARDIALAARDIARERLHRRLADRRYPSPPAAQRRH